MLAPFGSGQVSVVLLHLCTHVCFPSVQANGLHMSAGNVIVVAITATLAAIGSASIPNSALVSMVTVLQAVGMSQYIPQLSILLAMDWLIGMFRWVTD